MNIVYSYYVLDIIHRGHLQMIQNAKGLAGPDGQLIIGILTDEAVMEKKPKPILPFVERLEIANSIKYVDLVVAQETYSPLPNIKSIKPDILAESTSHREEDINQYREYLESVSSKVVVLPYFPNISSTDIKSLIRNA
ncbi:adenylyltransferase/cytidyltransferase family protein [Alphaproteobacteria bacterium]|nr:adenylyltransferase/cytidyltransferase family protein [Alphaproteobacteria bacterium]